MKKFEQEVGPIEAVCARSETLLRSVGRRLYPTDVVCNVDVDTRNVGRSTACEIKFNHFSFEVEQSSELTDAPSNETDDVPFSSNWADKRTTAIASARICGTKLLQFEHFQFAKAFAPFPVSPPAHIKLYVSRTKFDPNFVVRSEF